MVETLYFWKTPEGLNWVGYSIAHNEKEIRIVEKSIEDRIKKGKMPIMYKKVRKNKILKEWNHSQGRNSLKGSIRTKP